LQPDRQRFPSGIRALADYIHSLGLNFGIYEDYGTETCAGYPGVLGHLEQDAKSLLASNKNLAIVSFVFVFTVSNQFSICLVDGRLFKIGRL
jgi:hypothetical protein